MFSYVCTACGKKTPADTLAPVCGCGGLFELDFKSPKWDDAKRLIRSAGVFSATATLWPLTVMLGRASHWVKA